MINTKYLPIFITVCLLTFVGIYFFKTTNKKTKDGYESVMTDRSIKDSIVYVHDTVWVDLDDKKVEKPAKPIPSITKYKVTDWVCAWGKWSGVVLDIDWSTTDDKILRYQVQHYNEVDGEWYDAWYFDTELEAGKCN